MKSKFFKLLMNGSVVALGTIALSACSSSSSMFGIYGDGVSSNYNSKTFMNNFSNYNSYVDEGEYVLDDDGEPLVDSDGNKLLVTDNMAAYYGTVFTYYFNNFAYSTSSELYADGQESSLASSFAEWSWGNSIFYLIYYVSNLCDLYNAGFKVDDGPTPNNNIITSNDSDLLEQFSYSWANVLSKGRKNLRFGIVGIEVKLSSYDFFPDVNSELTVNVSTSDDDEEDSTSSEDDDLTWSLATYDPPVTLQIAFELGYWHARTNNPTQRLVTDTGEIKDMIENTKAWGNSNIDDWDSIESKMYLVLNYTFTPELSYGYSDITTVDASYTYDTEDENYNPDTIKTGTVSDDSDSDEDVYYYITWSDELVKTPILPYYNLVIDGTSDTATSIDYDWIVDSINDILDLLDKSTYKQADVEAEQAKFEYSLKLQKDGIL